MSSDVASLSPYVYACGKPQATPQVVPPTDTKGVLDMANEITTATEAFLNALTAKEQADKAHEEARELLLSVYAKHGVSESDCGELSVKVSPADRRSFDVDKLRELISAPLFRTVTKPSVDTSAWDRAVKEGKISAKALKACVSVTTSVRVLVRPAKGAVKPTAKSEAV